jgi:hypothetical protein
MTNRVARALGDVTPRAPLNAAVRVTRAANGYRAALRIQDAQRTLENAQCDVLADSVALVIALSASDNGSPSQTHLVLAVAALGSTVIGPLPKPAFGAGMSAALEGALSLRWEISGSYYAAQSLSYDQLRVGADFRMFRVAARGCRVWSLGDVDLAPCLGVVVYGTYARGFGGTLQSSAVSYVWGPELSLLLRLRIARHFALQLSTGVSLAVGRQRFSYKDLGPLHQPALLPYQLLIAPEVLF